MYRVKDIFRRIKKRVKSNQRWSYELSFGLWKEAINTSKSEELSGVYQKIESLERIGAVKVIGGINTGSNDEIFSQLDGESRLLKLLVELPQESYLFMYSPHPFWTNSFSHEYQWIPSWSDLYSIFDHNPDWSVYQYSPTFDPAGRYFFVAQKIQKEKRLATLSHLSRKTYHVFYFKEGGDLTLSRSNMALSAHLCSALSMLGAKVYAHDMNDIEALSIVNPDDILIGHVGSWVKNASEAGFTNIVLFFPANQWYPTRNNPYFESSATIAEQVRIAKMVIAQSGSIWRMTSEVGYPEKWRWIDLGVDPCLFPKIKKTFNRPGKRKFLFFHLYDEAQKGADLALEMVKTRPNYEFVSINGRLPALRNVRNYSKMPNTSSLFRNLLKECDFILIPSHEDAQPGSYIEAAAIGLIPVASYTSGYSLSFPYVISPNNLENWLAALDLLQNVDEGKLIQAQNFTLHYLNVIHNWSLIKQQVLFYLREAF
jgi:hypothetical protein